MDHLYARYMALIISILLVLVAAGFSALRNLG